MLGPTHAAFRVALSIPPPLPPRPQLLVPLSASSSAQTGPQKIKLVTKSGMMDSNLLAQLRKTVRNIDWTWAENVQRFFPNRFLGKHPEAKI